MCKPRSFIQPFTPVHTYRNTMQCAALCFTVFCFAYHIACCLHLLVVSEFRIASSFRPAQLIARPLDLIGSHADIRLRTGIPFKQRGP